MKEKLNSLKKEIINKVDNIKSIKELYELKVVYLGKKGKINEFTSLMKDLKPEEKKELGMALNSFNNEVNELFEKKQDELELLDINQKLSSEEIDITLPGTKLHVGGTHPLTKVVEEIEELFFSMGYDIVEGPEIESDLYNFEKLNIPKDHPARDAHDSFYIDPEYLLRTHTSPVQARTMEKTSGPIRIIVPGKTYRRDNDATHSHQFMQIEGLVIGEDISMADLKGTLEVFAKKMFGDKSKVRFRPSFFPFTEPSIEVDVSCFKCDSGCSLCKHTSWIEILGAGMVHPNVLTASGYDPNKYTAFAFGMGLERVAMLKYGINDIRHFYNNDLRFLDDFNRFEGDNNEIK